VTVKGGVGSWCASGGVSVEYSMQKAIYGRKHEGERFTLPANVSPQAVRCQVLPSGVAG
jgi:hypothetical protein